MSSYQSEKLIPWTPQPRTVPCKVLIVGLWRTGTSSLLAAFRDFGYYNTYPRRSPGANTWNSLEYNTAWNKAIDDKFIHGKTIARETLDELMGDCMVISGVPCFLFLDDLLAAYPDAKVILTTRDLDAWHNSIQKSFHYISTRPIFRVASLFNTFFKEKQGYLDRVKYWGYFGNIPAFGKVVHKNHVEKVRLLAQAGKINEENFLELKVGHGWEPLCEFLGVDVPKGKDYPRVNDLGSVQKMFATTLIPRAWWVVMRGIAGYTVPVAVLGAIWWLKGGRDFPSLLMKLNPRQLKK
ncbi:uncharacterized protein PAC_05783 [Phialocephala subalpina]|uniref:NAD dependent epimerase/dehydratase n=1 Tax=Phialocephala subalpina TaxID=576137 RepID=A0A1L7WSZ6_9HELO|nr:uncharacterized protein PAC_05783 [Phialocephala subalpina]